MAQEKWLVDGPKTIDVEGVRSLKVGLINGQVDIIGHDEPGARIEVHSVRGRDLLVSIDGDTLEVDHPQLRWDNFIEVFGTFDGKASADVSIMVPRKVALKCGVVNSSGLITGLSGDASVSSVNGDVIIDGLTGRLQLNTVTGEFGVRNHSGKIAAKTVSGDITASGEVSSWASDGVSGHVFLDLSGVPDEVRVNTVSGNITARLDAEAGATYSINKVGGRLQLDNAEVTGARGSYKGKYGHQEGRWTDVRINTVTGDVSVMHAVRA
jgi:Putative adhesin